MDTPSVKEEHISQISELQLLQKLGYNYTINQNLHNKVGCFIVQYTKV